MRLDARPPVGSLHVDQRIHVDVRVAGVAEDHAAACPARSRMSRTPRT